MTNPSAIAPPRLIGMKIFLVMGWQTKMAAERAPIQSSGFRHVAGRHFTKATLKITTAAGAHSQVWKFSEKHSTMAALTMASTR